MAFSNLECWAVGGADQTAIMEHANFGGTRAAAGAIAMDPFNLQQVSSAAKVSNGYYGFSYIKAAHKIKNKDTNRNNNNDTNNTDITSTIIGGVYDPNNNENENNNNNNNNNNNYNNNNNNNIYNNNSMSNNCGAKNDVNDSNIIMPNGNDVQEQVAAPYVRCLKRSGIDEHTYAGSINHHPNAGYFETVPTKRFRIAAANNDDSAAAAQYFNDFFNLPTFQEQEQPMDMDLDMNTNAQTTPPLYMQVQPQPQPQQQQQEQQSHQQYQQEQAQSHQQQQQQQQEDQQQQQPQPHYEQHYQAITNTITTQSIGLKEFPFKQQQAKAQEQQQPHNLFHLNKSQLPSEHISNNHCITSLSSIANFAFMKNNFNNYESTKPQASVDNNYALEMAEMYVATHGGCIYDYHAADANETLQDFN